LECSARRVTSADFQASDCSAYHVCTTTVWQGMMHVFPPISPSCMPRARLSISPANSFAHPLSDV
jgi:hypothetical protein